MELDKRLAEAVKKRNDLSAEAQRIAGRREAAINALSAVEQEIVDRGLDPETLSETVIELRQKYEAAIIEFEKGVEDAHTALSPYLSGPN